MASAVDTAVFNALRGHVRCSADKLLLKADGLRAVLALGSAIMTERKLQSILRGIAVWRSGDLYSVECVPLIVQAAGIAASSLDMPTLRDSLRNSLVIDIEDVPHEVIFSVAMLLTTFTLAPYLPTAPAPAPPAPAPAPGPAT